MKIDYHIHSMFSADSKLHMPLLIKKAIKKKYSEVAFTEHFDLLPSEIAIYGNPSYADYSHEISLLRERFPALNILKGVEIGEYHLCHELVDEILNYCDPPDLKIASIHLLPDGTNVSNPMQKKITGRLIESYYRENLALVQHGNFDILGHLGIFKRYLAEEPDESAVTGIIRQIFRTIIEKGIALEVNISGLRNPFRKTIPSPEYLKLYHRMGGKLLVVGSDSHHIDHFDANYEKALKIIAECGFTSVARKKDKGWQMLKLTQ